MLGNPLSFLNTVSTEFFLSFIILSLLVFSTLLINLYETSKTLNNLIIIPTIFFTLFYVFSLSYFTPEFSITLFNGVLIYDEFTKFLHVFILICFIIYMLLQRLQTLRNNFQHFENNIIILLSILGMLLLSSTYNLITLYLALELQSLAFYILAALKNDSPVSSEASLKYFILGAVGSGFALYGISIIYGICGSVNLGNIFLVLNQLNLIENTFFLMVFVYAFLFLCVGILFKVGAAPFHTWLPDVYEGSPNHITLLFVIVPKIALIGLLIRLFFGMSMNVSEFFTYFFYISSVLSISVGSLAALQQKKIKRLLAYSSISHVGFILIGFVVTSYKSIELILFYLIVYMVMSINIWAIYLSIQYKSKPLVFLTSFTNFSKSNSMLAVTLALNLFSMAGIPPLVGFFSKLYLISLAIDFGFVGLASTAIILSVLSTFYYLRLIKIIFFDASIKIEPMKITPKIESLIISLTSVFIVLYFIFPEYILIYLEKLVFLLFI